MEPSCFKFSWPGELISPFGQVMLAPSTMAWERACSPFSSSWAAPRRASQISFRPSKAGAVSQNSSLLLLSCPLVKGISLFHFGLSALRGWFRPMGTAKSTELLHVITVSSKVHVKSVHSKHSKPGIYPVEIINGHPQQQNFCFG